MRILKAKPITAGQVIKDVFLGAAIGLAVSSPLFLKDVTGLVASHKPASEPLCKPSSTYEISIDGAPIKTKNGGNTLIDNKKFTVHGDSDKVILENRQERYVLPQARYVNIGQFRLIYVRCYD
jgi:hypothetical protein